MTAMPRLKQNKKMKKSRRTQPMAFSFGLNAIIERKAWSKFWKKCDCSDDLCFDLHLLGRLGNIVFLDFVEDKDGFVFGS